MTVNELYARFPEISPDLRDEPVIGRFADVFGDLLAVAHKPSNCSTGHDAGNHFYLALLGPISYYGYGLATRERVLADLTTLLDRQAADPARTRRLGHLLRGVPRARIVDEHRAAALGEGQRRGAPHAGELDGLVSPGLRVGSVI